MRNLHHEIICGVALTPRIYNGQQWLGESIVRPWKKAKKLTFLVICADFNSGANSLLKVQAERRDSPGTWENLKAADGVTDLQFTPEGLLNSNPSSFEDSVVLGTMDLSRFDDTDYSAIRLWGDFAGGAPVEMGAAYVLSELHNYPSGTVDDLLSKQLGGSIGTF